ncbi:pyridoxal 5'-phosphate synthase glutaminase subunit PdxT [Geomicrobium sp. JCM 19039]|uniref:pyridoxal 5'-phosphate synthase glutaminase subunit PdxT n=1 Tax=Geomicrobium sp. JCM 19039 TaxID=1460636 RepID=UPI00045F41E1|nr:pyridoxal 5'-phosphate synthase glutaminase subunit PdxT [Geomicrobium sp. JCM 19039]GAK14745.1 pyridoxine biosynthesis glutamine amidotransferase, glutaminase subunit [Geomicrobium sp. JCM 19039]
MSTIGVLALQGAVDEHIRMIEKSGANAIAVKRVSQLEEISGLIIPGGESTAVRRLIDKYHFFEPLQAFAQSEKPVFGTCAGLILMGRDHLRLIDMEVERNAFGRQRESFEVKLRVKGVTEEVEAVFIRAPLVRAVGTSVDVLSNYNDETVAVREGNFLACSFHPELTDDLSMHRLFVEMVENACTV